MVYAARYFHYPHFKYDVWAAQENGKLLAYVVTRTVTAQETGCAAVVRLVDSSVKTACCPASARRWTPS